MFKVNEVLKCKYHIWCISKQMEKLLGVGICTLNYKECEGVCEHYVNKYKEWENEGRKSTDSDKG